MTNRNRVWITATKKTNRWVVRWIDADGRSREKTTEFQAIRSNRKHAEKIAALKRIELENGGSLPPQDWRDFCDCHYVDEVETMAKGSRAAVNVALDHFDRICAPRDLAEIDSKMISRFSTTLRKEGKRSATIEGYVKRILSAVNWAHGMGYRKERLTYSIKGKRRDSEIRSRPITLEEFERMIDSVQHVRKNDTKIWKFYLKGLYWSGLRREESLKLGWDWSFDFSVDVSGDCPHFRVRGEGHKSGHDQLLPMAPEFAELLRAVPERQQRGRVFKLPKGTGDFPNADSVGRWISRIGRMANVVVTHEGDFATVRTMRKTFATRWASKLMPAELQKLMRHESIETTLKYYSNVQVGDLWDKMNNGRVETETTEQKAEGEYE